MMKENEGIFEIISETVLNPVCLAYSLIDTMSQIMARILARETHSVATNGVRLHGLDKTE